MKKVYLFMVLMVVATLASAQTYVSEDFTSATFPPSGWSIDAHGGNWAKSDSKNAQGDNLGEANLHWSPQFNGYTRFISPVVDLTGVTNLSIEFKHMLDFYGGSTEHIGVATRSGGGDWNVVWEVPGATIPAEHKILTISTPDVGASDFQFCLYFHGNSYNINDWYIDDIRLFSPYDHDVLTDKVLGDTIYFQPYSNYTPRASVYNQGLNTESFDVAVAISDVNGDVVFADTTAVANLAKGEYQDVTFGSYQLAMPDAYYTITVTTLLSGDMDSTNNSKSKYIYTYTHDRDMVLLEIGTGTGCPYCPGAAMGADDLIANGKPVAAIEYHSYNSGDPFNTPEAAARTAYYGISGYPTAVFDGGDSYIGGSNTQSLYTTYLPYVEAREAIKVGVGIQFTTTATNRGYHVDVTVMKYAPVLGSNFVLQFVVTESDIAYNWQGQSKLDFVERLMLPDQNGTPIDIANNNTLNLSYDFDIGEDWNPDNLEVIAFVQNLDTKEIINGHKEMLQYVGVVENSNSDINLTTYPNPVAQSANISFNLNSEAQTKISIYSVQGQYVATLVNNKLTSGKHNIKWTPDGTVSNGLYLMKAKIGKKSFSQKIAIQR